MERQLLERMVGAGVLIAALVVVGPAILDGHQPAEPSTGVAGPAGDELQTHTVRLTAPAPRPSPYSNASVIAKPNGLATTAPSQVTGTTASPDLMDRIEPAAPVSAPSAAPPAVSAAPRAAEPPEPKAQVAVSFSAEPIAAGGSGWYVQVGTFGQRDNAERLAGSLRSRGFPALLSTTEKSGRPLHRVRVGPASTRTAATALAERLAAAGHHGQLIAP